jgi:hypothetical protein
MTDRELLELAAKAAGMTGNWGELVKYGNGEVDLSDMWILETEEFTPWDPLNDDGDALRLAAVLDLDIQWLPNQRYVSAGRLGIGENIGWLDESGRGGALRRAITVAAAKIGKSL